jgi:flagellar protein FliO/FliZ
MLRPIHIALALLPAAGGAMAATAAQPFAAPAAAGLGTASGSTGLGQVTAALGAVLIAIFALAWIARRLRGVAQRGAGSIEVLADVALGQKERAVLVKVGRARLLIGVAPGQVRTLHVLGAEELEPAVPVKPDAVPERPGFSALLVKSLGR